VPIVPPLKDTIEGFEQPVDVTADGLAALGFYPQNSAIIASNVGIERDGAGNLILKDAVVGTKTLASLSAGAAKRVVGIVLSGAPLSTGLKGAGVRIPFSGTITGWVVLANVVGSVVVDVWKAPYGSFPPSAANSIAGTEKPTLSGQRNNANAALTTWTTPVVAGDVFFFNVDSVSTATQITVEIEITP
jgi:hypothetical protein